MTLSEIAITLIIALIVFGPDQLPDVARKVGKFMGQVRRTSNAVKREFYNELYPPADEIRRSFLDSSKELRSIAEDFHRTIRAEPPASVPPPPEPKPLDEKPK